MSLLVVGSLALDTINTPSVRRERVWGGSAFHFSIASSLFCNDTRIIGIVGSDYPKAALEAMLNRNINPDSVVVHASLPTFHWEGQYEANLTSRSTVKTELGAFAEFNPILNEQERNATIVFLGNIDPDLQLSVLKQATSPKLTVMDTMDYWIRSKPKSINHLLAKVDLLIINSEELELLSGECNILKAIRSVLSKGLRWIIIKKGEHGAILAGKEGIYCVPAYPLEALVETTGAGDSFAGGLIGYLHDQSEVNWENLRRAMIVGNIMGSFSVEGFGTERLQTLTLGEFEQRISEMIAIMPTEQDIPNFNSL